MGFMPQNITPMVLTKSEVKYTCCKATCDASVKTRPTLSAEATRLAYQARAAEVDSSQ